MNSSKLKILQIIHGAFAMAVTLFLIVSLMLHYRQEGTLFDTSFGGATDSFIAPAFAVIMAVLGNVLFKKQLEKIEPGADFETKLPAYQTAVLMRAACFEAAGLFNVVSFFLNGHYIYIIAAVVMVIAMIVTRPTRQRIISDLNLAYPDTEKI